MKKIALAAVAASFALALSACGDAAEEAAPIEPVAEDAMAADVAEDATDAAEEATDTAEEAADDAAAATE